MRAPRPLVPGLVALLALTACAQQPDGVGSAVTPPSAEPSATGAPASPDVDAAPSATAPPAGAAGPVEPGEPEVLVSGLEAPWGLDFLPDGAALVTERDSGRLLRVAPGGGEPTVVGTVDIDDSGEGGLLGVAVSPSYADDGAVLLYRSTAQGNEVLRVDLSDHTDGEPLEVVDTFGDIPHARVHNGGRLAVGPDDMLYVTTGDSAASSLSQDPDSLAGKVLRLTPELEVPADNPDPSSPVFTLGHRNVQGLAWDDDGRLYASEFGADTFDELNLLEAGQNYGWPTVEGAGGGEELTDPLLTWAPSEASPSGIALTEGAVWVATLRGQRLWQVPLDGTGGVTAPVARLQGDFGRLRDAAEAPDGSLWVLTSNRDGRGTPAPDDDRVVRVPLQPA